MERRRGDPPWSLLLLPPAILAVLHLVIVVRSWDKLDYLLRGDRASGRFKKIGSVFDAPTFGDALERIVVFGNPGDYLLHGALFAIGGIEGLRLTQVAVSIVGVIFLMRIALRYFGRRTAFVAGMIYVVLPGTIDQAHALVTEAWFNPLLIVTTFYMLRALEDAPASWRDVALVSVGSVLLTQLRVIYLPIAVWFGVSALAFGRGARDRWRTLAVPVSVAAVFLLAALLPQSIERVPDDVVSDHGVARNLYVRANRTLRLAGEEMDAATREQKAVSVGAFVAVAAEHPGELARTYVSDVINFAGNSGINTLLDRRFEVLDVGVYDGADRSGNIWKDLRDEGGLVYMVREMLVTYPSVLIVNVGASVVLLLFYLLALAGFWFILRGTSVNLAQKCLMAGIVVGLAASVMIAGSARWTHRTPMEFLLALAAAEGLLRGLGLVRATPGRVWSAS